METISYLGNFILQIITLSQVNLPLLIIYNTRETLLQKEDLFLRIKMI